MKSEHGLFLYLNFIWFCTWSVDISLETEDKIGDWIWDEALTDFTFNGIDANCRTLAD